MKEQFVDLLQRSVNEITQLRASNERMAARLDMFDKCVMLLTAQPQSQSQGMAPDLVWEINKYIDSQRASD